MEINYDVPEVKHVIVTEDSCYAQCCVSSLSFSKSSYD